MVPDRIYENDELALLMVGRELPLTAEAGLVGIRLFDQALDDVWSDLRDFLRLLARHEPLSPPWK